MIRGKTILDHINLCFEKGRIYGLRGVNGSGKTMLMRAVAGFIYADHGEISVNGRRLGTDLSFPEKMGLLIENPAFLDRYSGPDNLKLLASLKQVTDEAGIREALRRVGLSPDDKRAYRKYSLGMKQRLGLAAAVMEKPELLLLDEATNALDVSGINLLEHIIKEEKDRGCLVILTSHNEQWLRDMSDEIITISEGRITDHVGRDLP